MSSDTPGHPVPLLPPIPLDQLHWRELPDRFTDRTVRRICRDLADVEFLALRHQVSVLASAIREDLSIDMTNAELPPGLILSAQTGQCMSQCRKPAVVPSCGF
jgi:hypothetical protein